MQNGLMSLKILLAHGRLTFFENKDDLIYRIGKADSPLCLCGLMETCSHLLFDCPIIVEHV